MKFEVDVDPEAWTAMMGEIKRPIAEGAVAALRETAANSVQEGRKDIAAAGPNFRTNWQERLQYRTKGAKDESGEASLAASAVVFHKYGIAGVFEHGATIEGKPLLWIPTERGGPAPSKSGKKLTSATVRGQPMLFDAADRDRTRKPLYIGVPSVTVPKLFHITEIVRDNVRKIANLFRQHFKGD